MANSTTNWAYCMQANHSVLKEEMTVVRANGVKRRMCEKCAERWHDDKKKRLASAKKSLAINHT